MNEDLYQRIISQRGRMGKIGERIPGYRGYQDAQVRREADHLLREHIAGQFQQQLNRLPDIESTLLENSGLEWLDNTRDVKSRMTTFIERIRTAARGYSGLFANIKVGSEELAKLYAFDEAMLRYVDDFAAAIDTLQETAASGEGIGSAIAALKGLVSEADQAFSLRSDVILGLAGAEPTAF